MLVSVVSLLPFRQQFHKYKLVTHMRCVRVDNTNKHGFYSRSVGWLVFFDATLARTREVLTIERTSSSDFLWSRLLAAICSPLVFTQRPSHSIRFISLIYRHNRPMNILRTSDPHRDYRNVIFKAIRIYKNRAIMHEVAWRGCNPSVFTDVRRS